MGLYKTILKKIVPIPKILEQDSFAFIGPHPDDIEVGCGATVAKLAKMGKRICFIVATDGRYGSSDPNVDIDKLIKTRQEEALASAKILGVEDVRFLGYSDCGDYTVEELSKKIAIELAKFKPDLIFTPDNHLRSETHPDHIKTGRASEIAMLRCAFPLMMKDLGIDEVAQPKGIAYYYTDKPNTYINVSKTYEDRISALKAHKSQFLSNEKLEQEFKMMQLYFKFTAIRHGLKRFYKYADAYRVLSVIHTHCAPEGSII
ncbi:MAG: PIG-L deacetylase family protein [Bacillota bacterium]|jgi:LmbE family N-acetylglucosaminyl deacetylase|nr:PIG-L deacetylase family protein [Bacillota bacterium]HHU43010.1 PIG-L family deacetylase [Clostridiales bacterium]